MALARTRAGPGAATIAAAGFMLTLSRGLPDLVAVLAIVVLPMLSRDWRERTYRRAVLRGLAGLAVLLAIWLGLLLIQGNDAPAQWWRQFLASALPNRSPSSLLNILSWFAWPVWPLALWTLWHEHRRLGRESVLHPLLAALAVTLLLGLWPAHSSGGGALPLLAPLALLATHGVASLKRGAAQGFYWFGVFCFLFFVLAFWVYFSAIEWGWPARVATHMNRLTPNYPGGRTDTVLLLVAAAATLVWLVGIPMFPRAKARPVLVWATGMALTWLLLIALFRPWAEAGWAYRPLIREMATRLPPDACLRADVDPAMTAMLRLHLAGRYRQTGTCAYWLLSGPREDFAAKEWPVSTLWTGFRQRDRSRYYALIAHDGR
jgi:hypothetical protein